VDAVHYNIRNNGHCLIKAVYREFFKPAKTKGNFPNDGGLLIPCT